MIFGNHSSLVYMHQNCIDKFTEEITRLLKADFCCARHHYCFFSLLIFQVRGNFISYWERPSTFYSRIHSLFIKIKLCNLTFLELHGVSDLIAFSYSDLTNFCSCVLFRLRSKKVSNLGIKGVGSEWPNKKTFWPNEGANRGKPKRRATFYQGKYIYLIKTWASWHTWIRFLCIWKNDPDENEVISWHDENQSQITCF